MKQLNSAINQTGLRIPPRLTLRAGDWIIVRSREAILATLDANACLDGLPFQPEMFAFCGRRMRVSKVAHKTCDNIKKTGGRRMLNAVHLEDGRCDGAAHGGCQADCVFFWKESWLRRENQTSAQFATSNTCSEETVQNRTRVRGDENSDDPRWVCQTTQLYDATTLLHWWDLRQYIWDVTSGNHSAWHMIKLLTFAGYRKLVGFGLGYRYLIDFFNRLQKLHGGKLYPLGQGVISDGKPTPTEALNLKPGDWVEVRSQDEILKTITSNGFNRGMRYDMEMSKYCGEKYRVQMRVERLINEQTGKMMTMKSPCIQLENVYCRAQCTDRRLGCPRASNSYWREIWLKRVSASTVSSQ